MRKALKVFLLACGLTTVLTACGGEKAGTEDVKVEKVGTEAAKEADEAKEPEVQTEKIFAWGEEHEAVRVPLANLEDIHSTPIECNFIEMDNPEAAAQIRLSLLESNGQADPCNGNPKLTDVEYLMLDCPASDAMQTDIYSYRVENGVRVSEEQEHYNMIRQKLGAPSIKFFNIMDGDLSEYEFDVEQKTMDKERWHENQASELIVSRVYQDANEPERLYVILDGTTDTDVYGENLLVLLLKDGVIVDSVNWNSFYITPSKNCPSIDWAFTVTEEYDSAYVFVEVWPDDGK